MSETQKMTRISRLQRLLHENPDTTTLDDVGRDLLEIFAALETAEKALERIESWTKPEAGDLATIDLVQIHEEVHRAARTVLATIRETK